MGARAHFFIQLVALFFSYFLTAWLGLKIGAVSTFATLIWPPTGIALAALVIGGTRLWPAVALGAFLVNWLLGAPPLVALGMATGNTLEAVVGASLLRWIGFQRSLERLRDVFILLIFAALLSTAISATLGVSSLYLGGVIQGQAFHPAWTAWWFGDVMGNLIVAPFLLAWSDHLKIEKVTFLRALELIAFGAAILFGSLFFLTDFLGAGNVLFPQAYLIFPLLMLVAVRLDQRWTVTAIVIVSVTVLWSTATGHGRFQSDSLSLRLFQAQIFLGVVAISKMVLAAAVMERRQREKENKLLYQEAHDALIARDEFLSIASHELKTPLTALLLQLQIFSRVIKKGSEESEKAETVSIPKRTAALVIGCEKQSKKLSALLNDLLDLTRIRLRKLELSKENVDLCEVVRSVMEQFRAETADLGVGISFQCATEVTGFWDRLRVEQIITNLISNALKYGERKPVSIIVEKDEVRGVIRLMIQDQGLGIRPEMREKIFERFERGGIDGQKISGLGLGLYICRQIAEAHGGRIRAESEVEKGSTFTVELPMTEARVTSQL